jgi:hypothetical protein
MSRLIDADKLIEDVLNSMPTGSARGVFRAFIEEQPTAFDVDKVVEQLEKIKDKAQLRRDELSTLKVITSEFIDKKGYERGRVYAFDDAIDIVKAGEIDE